MEIKLHFTLWSACKIDVFDIPLRIVEDESGYEREAPPFVETKPITKEKMYFNNEIGNWRNKIIKFIIRVRHTTTNASATKGSNKGLRFARVNIYLYR